MGQDNSVWECARDVQSFGDEGGYNHGENTGSAITAWDPDPGGLRACDITYFEVDGCKLLLVEIVRRAVFDWVLYRSSTRHAQRQIAEDAYHWLFAEEPGTRAWVKRAFHKKELTSLFGICAALSIDPDVIRMYAKRLTPKDIAVSRPNSYRRRGERAYQRTLPRKSKKALLETTQVVSRESWDAVDVEVSRVAALPTIPAVMPHKLAIVVARASATADALKILLRKTA